MKFSSLTLCLFLLTATATTRRARVEAFSASVDSKLPRSPVYDKIPSKFEPLFSDAVKATVSRSPDNTSMGHDPFRFEWGTWVDEEALASLMERVNEVQAVQGICDVLKKQQSGGDSRDGRQRIQIAGGEDWDCILHLLPQDSQWRGRWPTGSWSIVKPLIGVTEVAMLRGPNRDGIYTKATTKDLRGGSDGAFAGGKPVAGVDCIKYVGGPIRSYTGKSEKNVLLEVIVRPPVSQQQELEPLEPLDQIDLNDLLCILIPEPEPEEEEEEEEEQQQSKEQKAKTKNLSERLGMTFDKVGGLDQQLDSIARRVLASRANPEAARRLGVSHVRGILLSGPPGCGKTLMARELARLLGAREPQIVNGPEILDKFIGEAEKKVRALFAPAEQEYAQVGDDSALHIIILDEMDAIARKRGTMTADTTGVRDSVVNQLLAKMDGVKEASNVLVVGLTNRPELLDPALLRPGRLEVHLRVELPDLAGRRDILRIHTRSMKEMGAISSEATSLIEDLSEHGVAARSEHFSGAELAGLMRSAASFALARMVDKDGMINVDSSSNVNSGNDSNQKEQIENNAVVDGSAGVVSVSDLHRALLEVRPALGKQDEVLKCRFPLGISSCSLSMKRILRDLQRFTTPVISSSTPRLQSLLLVGAGAGGTGATALAAWAAAEASLEGSADYVRFITALDVLTDGAGSGEEARAAALVDRFSEAREMSSSLLVLDDVDQLCAGSGPGGYSSIMIATLRALLRSPPPSSSSKAEKESSSSSSEETAATNTSSGGKTMHILASTSRSDAACVTLHELFEETIVVPMLSEASSVAKLLADSFEELEDVAAGPMAELIINRMGQVGCKTALRLAERAMARAAITKTTNQELLKTAQLEVLAEILDDLAGDEVTATNLCEVL